MPEHRKLLSGDKIVSDILFIDPKSELHLRTRDAEVTENDMVGLGRRAAHRKSACETVAFTLEILISFLLSA